MQDPRMELRCSPIKANKPHVYVVAVKSELLFETADRHKALQGYIAARKMLNDFADDPTQYLVRLYCDGVEYLCDQESFPPSWRDRGKSCRQLTGAVRPYPWERQIP